MKLIIDIVPNHIARKYKGINNLVGVKDFGANDDVLVVYKRDSNFYYITNSNFEIPEAIKLLNGEKNPLVDGKFEKNPAKSNGNGPRLTRLDKND